MLEDFACELRSKDEMGCESITNVSNRVWGLTPAALLMLNY